MTIGCNARESTKMMKMPIVPFAASPAMAQNLQRSGATQLLVMRRSKPTISDPFRTNSTWEDPTESQHERWHGKSFLTPTASWRIKLDMDDIDMCIQIHIFSVYVTPSPRKSVDEIRHKMKFWNDMMTYLVATMAPSSSPKKTGMQHYSTEPSCCPKSPVRAWDFAPNLLRTWMVDWNDSRICLSKLPKSIQTIIPYYHSIPSSYQIRVKIKTKYIYKHQTIDFLDFFETFQTNRSAEVQRILARRHFEVLNVALTSTIQSFELAPGLKSNVATLER